ncbi:DUF2441 domain-containing protein [Bacillus sp. JJ1533]|uniref:DUF2441 domain-containing protein n=1 Tax=Bacillus sp. JJ1533 TaxID=3122959 RepID=UPI002FFEB778
MDIVTGLKLYHINTNKVSKIYVEGEEIITPTNGYNRFFGDYDVKDVRYVNTIESLGQGLTYYWHFARETIFEEIRLNVNKDLPSRQKCIWLSSGNEIEYWKHELNFNSFYCQLLELELHGKLFKCDSLFVSGGIKKLNDVRIDATNYWNQEKSDQSKIEYLFEGKAIVSKVL